MQLLSSGEMPLQVINASATLAIRGNMPVGQPPLLRYMLMRASNSEGDETSLI